ncbi:MAG: DUF2281 domain-containing protein [Chloroflexi bacterium]|nr:DUF2281 domain-containing protein [Chloroflexota bacterium]
MHTLRDVISKKMQTLPEYSLREVLEFVEFLTWKQANQKVVAAELENDPILSVVGILSSKPLTDEEIDQELYGAYGHKEEDDSSKRPLH